jgi:hypothetical protein
MQFLEEICGALRIKTTIFNRGRNRIVARERTNNEYIAAKTNISTRKKCGSTSSKEMSSQLSNNCNHYYN